MKNLTTQQTSLEMKQERQIKQKQNQLLLNRLNKQIKTIMLKLNLKFKITFDQLIMVFQEFNYIEPSEAGKELAERSW